MTDTYTPSPQVIADLTTLVNLKAMFRGDEDQFGTANATADTDRWSSDYYTGTEGGSADINTTTSGKLMIKVDPDATPTAAGYAVKKTNPEHVRYWTTMSDLDLTWGTQTSGAAEAGIMITKGTAYDSQNYLSVARYKTSGTNNIRVTGKLNNVAITTITASVTDDALALKVERAGDEFRFWYSTVKYPTYDWTYIGSVEDTSGYMSDQTTIMLYSYSSGGNTDNIVQGDFDNWYLTIDSEALDEAIAILGRDNANNEFSTSNVSYNIDGTIIERLESILKAIQIVAASASGFEEDGTGPTLYKTLIAVKGTTTGAGSTTTYADTNRTEGSGYWIGNKIFALSGSALGQVRTIVGDNGAGTITVEPALAAAPGNGIEYVILTQKGADYIIGDNTNNNAYDSSNVVANSNGSILERLEHILISIGGTTGTTTSDGTTTTAIDTARTEANDYWNGAVFICVDGANAGLARPVYDFVAASDTLYFEPAFPNAVATGVSYLILTRYDTARLIGADNNDNAIATSNVVRNDDGSVLERIESIKEDLRGTGGIASFPVAADIADGVSLAEAIRAILTSQVGGDDYDAYTNISNTANTSLNAVAQKFAAVIGCDNINTFSSTIQGSARTTVEAAFDALATYLSASGAAMALQVNGNAARNNLEQVLNDYFTVVGCNGANVFNPTVQGSARTTYEDAFAQLATYFVASGAAMSLQVNNNTARTNLQQALGDYFAVVGCDGANVFNPTIQGAAQTNYDAALNILASYFSSGGAAWSVQLNNQTARTNLEQVLEDFFAVVGVDGTNTLTNISNSANATINAVFQKFAALWGADGANTFGPTVAGSAQSTLESALTAVGSELDDIQTKVGAAGTSDTDANTSLHEIKHKNGSHTFSSATDSLEMLSDKAGGFSGDGGAAQDDSVKASLDLAHTDLDAIITDTEKIYDVSLGASPVSGSLASYIASGGTSLGTVLPVSKSLYDILHVDKYTDTGNTTGFTCTLAMGINETDIATLANGTALTGTVRRKIWYWLDMTNIDADVGGGDCTIRVKAKIDESNYRTVDTITWVNGTSDNGVLIEVPPFHHNLQVTFQMSVALAGDVSVPYRIVTENMEY